MEYLKQVHNFAVKWAGKFKDEKIDYIELVDGSMGDECRALGFKMDCGHSFSEEYGRASCSYHELNLIIDEVSDIELLGSAIFSQWRYFNHWAYDASDILNTENRTWFILALNRLAALSDKK